MITSSPGPTPNQRSMSIAPELHEFTHSTGVPVSFAISASSWRTLGPVVSHPVLVSASLTSSMTSSSMSGSENGMDMTLKGTGCAG